MMSLGTAMLKVGGSNLLDFISSPSSSSSPSSQSSVPVAVNKLGIAADTGDTDLSQEEILHRIQVEWMVPDTYKNINNERFPCVSN